MKRDTHWILIVLILVLLPRCTTAPRQPASGTLPSSALSAPPPADAKALVDKAQRAHQAGDIAAAIPLWERLATTYPNNAVAALALQRLGSIYLDRGQPERALQYYDYLIYTYSGWAGINGARLDQMRAWWAMGKKKQVMKEAPELWEASVNQPDVRSGLSRLLAEAHAGEGELETAFQWLSAGFAQAKSPEEAKPLAQVATDILKNLDEGTAKKLLAKSPSDFMRVFLEFRLAQLQMQQKGQADAGRDALRAILSKNPSHPIVPEIQAALRGTPGAASVSLPLHPERVGCLVPLNGPYARFGNMVMRGLNLAAQEWNDANPRQPVTLIVKDAQVEPDQVIKSFEDLTREEGVLGIIGPLGPQPVKAVAPLANKWGVPLLALTQMEEELTDNSFVLHVFMDNHDMVKALVRHCKEKLGFTRFAALYPDDRYGQRFSKAFAEVVHEMGGSLLASVAYKEKSTDFKDTIQKLMTVAKQNIPPTGVDVTPFEALFIPDQVQTVSLLAPQLPYYNVVGTTLLGTNLWGEGPLVQLGGAYVEQAIFATPFHTDIQSSTVSAFREKFQAVYHTAPSYLEAQAYDALKLLLHARSTLPPTAINRSGLIQNLLNTHDFRGVAGTYSFSPEGKLIRDYHLLQVLNGQLVNLP